MVFDDEVINELELYSVNNEMQEVYSGDLPKRVLKIFQNANKDYNDAYHKDFVKIIPGHEMVNGKPITKKQCGKFYVCYVDRLPKEEVEEMREYNKEMKGKYGFDFVSFLKDN
jgi:hypothetical protein